jgi:hypothetical protein
LAKHERVRYAAEKWKLAAAYEAAKALRAEWHYQRGRILEKTGQWEKAAVAYEAAPAQALAGALAQDGISRVCGKAVEEAKRRTACSSVEKKGGAPVAVCFSPAPSTKKNLASARIRCAFMVKALNDRFAHLVCGKVGMTESADAIVISQTCTAKTLIRSAVAKAKGALIVYDCCDPYADYGGALYGVYVARRFWDLIALANVITVPTEGMRSLLHEIGVAKPIVILPDNIDYQEQLNPELVPPTQSVAWFGNPGRGNLESGKWALQALKDRWGHAVTLITNPATALAPSDFRVEAWSYDGFVSRLRLHGLALVSQDPQSSYKSENRYVVSIMNGVPAISVGSESIAKLLEQSGFAEMSVADDRQLDEAMERLQDPAYRSDYVSRMQRFVQDRFGPVAVGRCFVDNVLQRALDDQFKRAKAAAE